MATRPRSNENLSEDEELLKLGIVSQNVLGEGSFSRVMLALWKNEKEDNERKIALKIINRATAPLDFKKKFLPRELRLLASLKHRNIIEMYHTFSLRNKTYICLEHAGMGDLLSYVQLKAPLSEAEALKLFYEICIGINFLHQQNIVHRDLKCENILLSRDSQIKIADFGFARTFNSEDMSKTFCGSAAYAAPELIRGILYDAKSADCWSTGVVLFIMVSALMPFRDENTTILLQDQQTPLQYPKKPTSSLRNLLQGILMPEVNLRLKIEDILQHEWMRKKCSSDALATSSDSWVNSTSLKVAIG